MDVDIYVGGGKHISLKVGDQLEFSIQQIEAKLSLDLPGVDSLENIRSALCIGRRNTEISDEETVNELREWANADAQTFMIKTIRKFRLFWPFSTALRGLFFDIVEYYRSLLVALFKQLECPELIEKIEKEYEESKTKSSSPLLYGIGKYEPLNKILAEHKHIELLEYIKDPNLWAYPGFCPFVSTERFKSLCKFPVDLIRDILVVDVPEMDLKNLKGMKPIDAPEMPVDIVDHSASGSPIELAKVILGRLVGYKDLIHKWELYYIECAKQISSLSKSD